MAMQNSNKTYRQLDKIHAAPRPHWVGDGFHVNPMFNHMVGDKRTDPFLMLDYAAKQYFEPNARAPRGDCASGPRAATSASFLPPAAIP